MHEGIRVEQTLHIMHELIVHREVHSMKKYGFFAHGGIHKAPGVPDLWQDS